MERQCAENGGLLMKNLNKILCTLLVLSLFITFIPTTAEAAAKPKLNKTNAKICAEQTVKLKVTNSSSKVTRKSSYEAVATVTSSGKVKGVKVGTCTITAKAGKKSVKCKVTVREHSWYTVEETGHYETTEIIVCGCGERFDTNEEFLEHRKATHFKHSASTGHIKTWVVDEPYEECLYCSKIKES
jgi:hypothetical protein